MYWRAFDKADDLDGKLGVVSRLTELYLQRNQFDRLLTRLQHQERDAERRPGPAARVAICLAQAYASSGDLGTARAELERAARRQRPRHPAAPAALEAGRGGGRHRERRQVPEAAQRAGPERRGHGPPGAALRPAPASSSEAQAVWSQHGRRARASRPRVLQAIDSLLGQRQAAAGRSRSPRRCSARTRATGRPSIARAWPWSTLEKPDEAGAPFRALLDLPHRRRREERDRQGPHPRPQAPGARPRGTRR